MSYQVLHQKYRPQKFTDVIGQDNITKTLQNAILQNRIANAYIFCGPRGVGKTSIARIFSKTLNCIAKTGEKPCNKCDSCISINQNNSMDVLEIDGASNNRVDEIRVLLENVQFSPTTGQYKIYIIDEVHMLSQGAFNALLKTLEEPPKHVKFIFATTEPEKVLSTIMSRCQRFDFGRISSKKIYQRLKGITKKEKIEIQEKACIFIARNSEGSLRDSLIILDQMISFSDKEILSKDVIDLLGMVDKEKIFNLSSAIIDCDTENVIKMVDNMINSGKDPIFIANSIIFHYRDLMIIKSAKEPTSDMVFDTEELEKIKQQIKKLSIEEIVYILQNLSYCVNLMKNAIFSRAILEVNLIKLTKRSNIMNLSEIVSKIEKMIKNNKFDKQEAISNIQNNFLQPKQGIKEKINKEKEKTIANITEEETNNNDSVDTMKTHWHTIMKYIKDKKMSIFAFLKVAHPLEISKEKLVIAFQKEHSFNKEVLEIETNKKVIQEAANKIVSNNVKIEFVFSEIAHNNKKDDLQEKKIVKKEMQPFIEKSIDIFGGQISRDIMEDTI